MLVETCVNRFGSHTSQIGFSQQSDWFCISVRLVPQISQIGFSHQSDSVRLFLTPVRLASHISQSHDAAPAA